MSKNNEEVLIEIRKTMNTLSDMCKDANLPMFVAICTESNKQDAKYETRVVSPAVLEVEVPTTKDYITDCFKIFNGYVPVIPNNNNIIRSFEDDLFDEIYEDEEYDD